MSTVKMIKADAQISLTFGVPFILKLQSVLLHLSEERTLEELNQFKELADKKEDFPETWMEDLHTLIMLVREIELNAEKTQQFSEVDPATLNTP